MIIYKKKKALSGLMLLLIALVMGGCGQGGTQDAVQTGAVQEGEIPDNADAESEGESEAEEGAESGMNKDNDAQDEDDAIDEETKEELTAQMLEENELDTSVVNSTKTTKGCTFTVPDDFSELEEVPGMYVTKRYPIDVSTIYYVEMGKDISLQLMTEESFVEQTQNNFKRAYGMDIKVNLQSFERIEIGGYPAFRILCDYELDGVEMLQLEYVINADKSYVITYSQTDDYDRMEEYEISAATIAIE